MSEAWRAPTARTRARTQGEEGQATVELALLFPVVLGLIVLVLQVALVGRSQLALVQAVREGARAAAIEGDAGKARAVVQASPGLANEAVDVTVALADGDGMVRVNGRYPVEVGIAGLGLRHRFWLSAEVAMFAEYDR